MNSIGHETFSNAIVPTGSQLLPIFGSQRVIFAKIFILDPLRALFANTAAIFAPLAPNNYFLQTLYPMKPFLKQLFQLVLNIFSFLGLLESYLLKYSRFSDF